ncbi:hypothetical protein SXCC_02671 [Gluconacetobacter sp. SXCC-1]|nr:hypothetical protein SXCC_02671 [Gluconacetobacter sp. SXCC-1]
MVRAPVPFNHHRLMAPGRPGTVLHPGNASGNAAFPGKGGAKTIIF